MNSNIVRVLIVLTILLISSLPASCEVYTVYTDREFGFWGVRATNVSNQSNFVNKTLTISTGDTVDWINMDSNDDRITLISNNNLWENDSVLSGVGKRFDFTFNSSGSFAFSIKENTRITLNSSNYTENESKASTFTYVDEDGMEHTYTLKRNTASIKADYLKQVTDIERFYSKQMTVRVYGLTIGNGTSPIQKKTSLSQISPSSGYSYSAVDNRIQIDARPKPTSKKAPNEISIKAEEPKPLESYHEFTLYEIVKRWYLIILGTYENNGQT